MTVLVIHTSAESYRRHRARGPVAAALWVGVCVQLYRLGPWGLVLGIVVGAVAVALAWRYVTGLRVELTDHTVTYRGPFRTRRWPLDQVGSVLRVDQLSVSRIQPALTWLVPRRADGRRLFQITSAVWPLESIDLVAERLAGYAVVNRVTEPVSAKEVGAAYPGALNLAQARPVLTGIVVSAVLLVAVTGGTYVAYQVAGG